MIKTNIGDNIRRYRKNFKWSLEEYIALLNEKAGTAYRFETLSSWERGKTKPPAELMGFIADSFDISIDELYGREKLIEGASLDSKSISNTLTQYALLEKAKVGELSQTEILEGWHNAIHAMEVQGKEIERLTIELNYMERLMEKIVKS